jgi:O-antigen/teichoic acid export membrane protein
VSKDVLANVLARAWVAAVLVVLTPIYLSFLGVEAYGLVGVFTALQTVAIVFDLGLGLTLNRELAKLQLSGAVAGQRARDTVRTFETVYWLLGIAIALVIVASASFGATSWLRPSGISPNQTSAAIVLMGIAIAAQWPSALYSGGLLGLRHQVSASFILAAMATIRGVGAVFVLRFLSPTVETFFAWQVAVSLLQTVVLRTSLRRVLPVADAPRDKFQTQILRDHFHFAADMTAITLLATLLTQLDKILLSSLVALEAFGYYALAGAAANGLYVFIYPVFNAVFPRLVTHISSGARELSRTYHAACGLMSVLVLPAAITLVVFAPEVMSAWLGIGDSASGTARLVPLIAAGTALNGLMNVPYALMLASGATRLPLAMNACAVVILIPLITILTNRFGTTGGAAAWLLLNLGYVAVGVPVMHARLLRGEAIRWYVADVGLPLTSGLAVALLTRALIAEPTDRLGMLTLVGLAAFVTYLASALATEPTRAWLLRSVRGRFAQNASA